MQTALELISNSSLKTNLPQFKVGQTVRIHQRIKEGGKERIQVFEGLIIKTNNGIGVNGTITVRKIVDGVGVERVYPIHSPNLAKIEIIKEAKVRRSKLYYMRDRTGKAARLKTTLLEGQIFEPRPLEKETSSADLSSDLPTETTAKEGADEVSAVAKEEETSEAPAEKTPAEETPAEEAKEGADEVNERAKEEEAAAEEVKQSEEG